jgi:hypothetical protein
MWKDIIKESGKCQETIEVSRWLSRATFDAIGKGMNPNIYISMLLDDMVINF